MGGSVFCQSHINTNLTVWLFDVPALSPTLHQRDCLPRSVDNCEGFSVDIAAFLKHGDC